MLTDLTALIPASLAEGPMGYLKLVLAVVGVVILARIIRWLM